MTVAELIKRLSELPPDGKVVMLTGEASGATKPVSQVIHYPEAGWGTYANTVELR